MTNRIEWNAINEQMIQQGFTCGHLLEEGVDHQYLTLDCYQMRTSLHENIRFATRAIGHIYNKTVHFLRNSQELFDTLQLPKNTHQAVRLSSRLFSYITRFDLIVSESGIKVI